MRRSCSPQISGVTRGET